MNKIKAILFDMDGVIIDSEKLKFWTWIDALKSFGIKLGLKEISKIKIKILGRRGQEISDFFNKIYGVPRDEVLKRRNELLQEVIPKYPLMPGVKEFLSKFKEKLKYALVTSSSKDVVEYLLKKFDIRKYFDVIISGEDVKKGKPDPNPYILAMKKLNVHPEECVVVEDAMSGIIAAKRAGVKLVVGFVHGINSLEDVKDADAIVQSFSELEKIIEEMVE